MYEIRNYHIRPESFAAYCNWAKTRAIPHLAKNLDLVGFWVSNDEPSQIVGAPMDALASANVTWIIRWPDMAARTAGQALFASPEWADVFVHLPGGLDNYTRMESKFSESLV